MRRTPEPDGSQPDTPMQADMVEEAIVETRVASILTEVPATATIVTSPTLARAAYSIPAVSTTALLSPNHSMIDCICSANPLRHFRPSLDPHPRFP